MNNAVKLDDELVTLAEFGPYAFILEEENKTMFKCERGFFWSKEQAPEIVRNGKRDEWGPNKKLLHHRDQDFRLVPFREDNIDIMWKKSITIASKTRMSAVLCSGKIVVDCRMSTLL